MSQSYLMVSQPTPSIPPPLPFLSSPDLPNVNTAPNTSPGHAHRQNYYPSSVKLEDDSKPKSDFDLNSLSTTHHSGESGGEHDSLHAHATSKPVLETDGVVSSEVGDVPGILHQDLHPDGQPRRPMNAFMIFARHRRPVVQAKEPGLKTGEISKRLSHDWKNLPEEDKSHYLEQAKLLKDEFHSRFPEYVYKRRPNNTGKRRSSTSQQQLHPKFAGGPGAPQALTLPPGPMNGCMSHPSDLHPHHYHPHLHPTHGEMYHPGHSHHLHHHPHVQPPSRPLSSIAQHSPKLASPNFYPSSTNPTSPRYHHIGHSSNCTTLAPRHPGPYPACGPSLTSANNAVATSALHSPRPGSPVPSSSVTPSGMPYMRLSNPHTVSYQAQASSHQYPWFSNDNSYGSPSSHHVGTVQTPLSANRPSFSYSSWPPSVASDSHMSACAPSGNEDSDPSQAANPSRAASYSAGPPIYRPPSPVDRARQLSLPSHSLTASTCEASNSLLSDSAPPYHDRLHHDNHSSSTGVQNASNHNYGAYATSDILNNSQRPSYSAAPTAGGFGSNSVRNGLAPSSNGTQANNDSPAGFEQHHSPNINQPSNPISSQSTKNHFASHCSPLHHPAPPPPPPAAATSHHHHQHSSSHPASVNAATSIEY